MCHDILKEEDDAETRKLENPKNETNGNCDYADTVPNSSALNNTSNTTNDINESKINEKFDNIKTKQKDIASTPHILTSANSNQNSTETGIQD